MTDELTRRPVGLRPAPGPRRTARGLRPPGPGPAAAQAAAERGPAGPDRAAEPAVWSAEVCTDDTLWAPGSPSCAEWDRLWARSAGATVFQHSAWLQAWWSAYGTPGRLRVVLVRRSGVPAAAAPLLLCRRGPFRVLTPVGVGVSDYGGVLVAGQESGPGRDETAAGEPADADKAEALSRLRAALADVNLPVDLRELPPGSDARLLADGWPHRVRIWTDSPCLTLPARTFEETVGALPRRTAARIRNKSRRIDQLGVTSRLTPADEAGAALADLLRLHREQWKGRGITAEHLTGRFGRHLLTAVPALIEAGYADLVRYRYDGELVGCELMLHSADTAGSYLSGLSPRLRQKADLATLILRNGLGLAVEREATRYSILRGLEPYKLRWSPRLVQNERVLLGGRGAAATLLYAQTVAGRKVMVRLAKKVLRRDDRTAREMRARLGECDLTDTE